MYLSFNTWYANSYFRVRLGDTSVGNVTILFWCPTRWCSVTISLQRDSVLSHITSSCVKRLTDWSYIAYTYDVLLISRANFSLVKSICLISKPSDEICLKLNTAKCVWLVFNTKRDLTAKQWFRLLIIFS